MVMTKPALSLGSWCYYCLRINGRDLACKPHHNVIVLAVNLWVCEMCWWHMDTELKKGVGEKLQGFITIQGKLHTWIIRAVPELHRKMVSGHIQINRS